MALPSFKLSKLREQPEDVTVFMCSKCRLPLGDSSDWDGLVCREGVIHLKAVSENVCYDSEPIVSSFPNETGCVFQILQCKGCMSPVGRIYLSTPRGLDSKVDVFTISVSAVTKYTLGTTNKQVVSPCDAPVTLEKCHIFEDEIVKCKRVLGVLQRKVQVLEARLLQFSRCANGDGDENEEEEHA